MIVLILLVVVSLAAAVAMRNAVTQERIVNNYRQESTAQSLAEFALGYCEAEVRKDDADRVTALQGLENLPAQGMGALQWERPTAWAPAVPGATATAAFLRLDSTLAHGAPPPQCLVERLSVGQGGVVAVVVTARGFSNDYRQDTQGKRMSGSAVWLQSFLYFN